MLVGERRRESADREAGRRIYIAPSLYSGNEMALQHSMPLLEILKIMFLASSSCFE